jgi:SOS response associated peptidase (SRAP)
MAPKSSPTKFALRRTPGEGAQEEGERVETFTIIRAEASKLAREVHDGMPVIIALADYRLWRTSSPATAKKMLVPFASGLTLTPVSDRVDSVRNNWKCGGAEFWKEFGMEGLRCMSEKGVPSRSKKARHRGTTDDRRQTRGRRRNPKGLGTGRQNPSRR